MVKKSKIYLILQYFYVDYLQMIILVLSLLQQIKHDSFYQYLLHRLLHHHYIVLLLVQSNLQMLTNHQMMDFHHSEHTKLEFHLQHQGKQSQNQILFATYKQKHKFQHFFLQPQLLEVIRQDTHNYWQSHDQTMSIQNLDQFKHQSIPPHIDHSKQHPSYHQLVFWQLFLYMETYKYEWIILLLLHFLILQLHLYLQHHKNDNHE